jgi:hypothetical protein
MRQRATGQWQASRQAGEIPLRCATLETQLFRRRELPHPRIRFFTTSWSYRISRLGN